MGNIIGAINNLNILSFPKGLAMAGLLSYKWEEDFVSK